MERFLEHAAAIDGSHADTARAEVLQLCHLDPDGFLESRGMQRVALAPGERVIDLRIAGEADASLPRH